MEQHDAHIEAVFTNVMMKMYPKIPDTSISRVIQTALKKGEGKVGRTTRLEMQEKVYFAVRAHIRHFLTDYDAMLKGKGTKKWEARRTVASQIASIAASWGEPPNATEYREHILRHGNQEKEDDDEDDEYENEPSTLSSQDLDSPQPTRRITRSVTQEESKPTPTATSTTLSTRKKSRVTGKELQDKQLMGASSFCEVTEIWHNLWSSRTSNQGFVPTTSAREAGAAAGVNSSFPTFANTATHLSFFSSSFATYAPKTKLRSRPCQCLFHDNASTMTLSLTQRQLFRQLAQVRAPNHSLFAAAQCSSSSHYLQNRCVQTIHLYRRFSASSRLFQERQQPISQVVSGTAPFPDAQAKPRRRRPRWFSATVLFLLGAIAGSLVRVILLPPPPAIPGSPADEALKEKVRKLAEELPIVQELQNEPGCKTSPHFL